MITIELTIDEIEIVLAALRKHHKSLNPDGFSAQVIARVLEHIKAQATPKP